MLKLTIQNFNTVLVVKKQRFGQIENNWGPSELSLLHCTLSK